MNLMGERTCEKINALTQRREGTKTCKEKRLCLPYALRAIEPWREIVLLFLKCFTASVACNDIRFDFEV
jgi:hypothetical protein